MFQDSVSLYSTMKTCYKQYHDEREIGWLDWYLPKKGEVDEDAEENVEPVSLQSEDEFNEESQLETDFAELDEPKKKKPLQTALQATGFVLYSLRAVKGLSNMYFWYEKGFNATRAIALGTVLYWELFPEKSKVEQMKAWDRYAYL